MDITGHFGADFTDFKTAVDQATTKLKGFEVDAAKVDDKLQRLGDAFSGTKTIQQAELMVKAITDLGGATTLTAKEQERVNRTLDEAIAKYKALGKEAPADMRALADATKQVATSAEQAAPQTALMSTAMSHLVSLASIATLAKWATDAFQFAGAMQDLAARTGVAVETLQRWDVVARTNGTTLEALASAAFTLSRNLAGGSSSTTAALAELGLKLEDVQRLDPGARFETIATAAAGLTDPLQRARVEAALFGKAVDDLHPALASLKDATDPLIVATTEQTAAFARASNALVGLSANWKPLLIQWIDAKLNLTGLVRAMDEWNAKADVSAQVQTQADAATSKWNVSLRARAAVPIPITVADENRLIGELNRQLADSAKQTDAAAEAAKKLADEQRKAADAQQKMLDTVERSDRAAAGFTAKVVHLADALLTVGTHAAVSTHDLDAFTAAQDRARDAQERAQRSLDAEFEASFKAAQQQDALNAAVGAGADPLDAFAGKVDRTSDSILRMNQVMLATAPGAYTFASAFDQATAAVDRFAHAQYAGDLNAALGPIAMIAAPGGPGPLAPGSHRAAGGPVTAGQSYLVGERGPELYVPGASGAILPGGAAGPTINVYITQPLGTPSAIAAAVRSATVADARTRGVRLPTGA